MTSRPLSTSQIERLGGRLVATSAPAAEDLDLLHRLLAAYSDVLARAVERVRSGTGTAPTARIKNTGTILEKLHRYGGSWLKSIQDLAGMRIVQSFDRNDQDALVAQIVELFASDPRPPKVIDRRADPVQGYRAVHIVAFPEGVPVEIQVRTRWQHEWAEVFEKLADQVGRGIRYGEPPTAIASPSELDAMAPSAREAALSTHAARVQAVQYAIALAEVIDALERIEAEAHDQLQLDGLRTALSDVLAQLRHQLEGDGVFGGVVASSDSEAAK